MWLCEIRESIERVFCKCVCATQFLCVVRVTYLQLAPKAAVRELVSDVLVVDAENEDSRMMATMLKGQGAVYKWVNFSFGV